jgi:hypothetical protein
MGRRRRKSVMIFGPGADGFVAKLKSAYRAEWSNVRPRVVTGPDRFADHDVSLWSGDGESATVAAPDALGDMRLDLRHGIPRALSEALR